jgi:hypothetical protein
MALARGLGWTEAAVYSKIAPHRVRARGHAILIKCLLVTVPTHTWTSFGALLLAASVIGIAYSAWVAIDMKRRRFYQTVDIFDRLWYALTPMAGYFIVMIAACGLMAQRRGSLDLLAAGLGVLLLGLRNAWDMTVWVVMGSPNR